LFTAEIIDVLSFFAVRRTTGVCPSSGWRNSGGITNDLRFRPERTPGNHPAARLRPRLTIGGGIESDLRGAARRPFEARLMRVLQNKMKYYP
jgi:hypothetical protein